MKKTSILSTLLAGMVAMTACTDYNTPVAEPFGYEPEDPATASITIAGQDFAQPIVVSDASPATVNAFSIDLSATPELPANTQFEYTLNMSAAQDMSNSLVVPMTVAEGVAQIATSDLDATVKSLCGSKAQAYTVYAQLTVFARNDERGIQLLSNVISATVTPLALPIESAYYLIGDMTGWNIGSTDYPFTTTDGVVFTYTTTVTGQSNWKVAPQSAVDNSDWNVVLGNAAQDQNPATEGTLLANGGSMLLPDAGTYVITLDMSSYTYTVALQ